MLDVLLISPNSRSLYQDLGKQYSAIEPNCIAAYLASSVRKKYGVAIYDLEAEPPKDENELISRIEEYSPKFILFVSMGQNVNSSAANMNGVVETATTIKEAFPNISIGVMGTYVSALPNKVLEENCIDIAFTNDGYYSLSNLLSNNCNPEGIKGIWYKKDGRTEINPPEEIVPQERLEFDIGLPSFDLMPSLNKYRAPLWHDHYSGYQSPYVSLYTSYGCPFKCSFCCINSLNRNSNDLTKSAADFNVFRYFSPEFIIKQFEYFANQGVRLVKIIDEMFVLRKEHFLKLSELIAERFPGQFNMWCYSRVNTVRPQYLETLKKAGFSYLALGIESANQIVRQEIEKGHFKDLDIRNVCKMIEDSGLHVGGNFIVGLPGDNWESMQETLNLALEILPTNFNIYAACALPGSPLYLQDKAAGKRVPEKYSEFGFLSYDHICSSTEHLTSEEILAFRDYAFQAYFTNPRFHAKIRSKFGDQAVENIKKLTQIKLKRKLLGD